MSTFPVKPTVKVCVHADCRAGGSERVYAALCQTCSREADIQKTEDCFRFCKMGPNVAVNGNVLHHVRAGEAVSRVRSEIRSPAKKVDGVGTRALDDLDDVLDDFFSK